MRLSRRGFAAAVDHPNDQDRARRMIRRRARGSATLLTLLLLVISAAELAWIFVR